MLCPSCNTDVPANASFCPKCGSRMDDATGPRPAAAAAPAAGGAPAAGAMPAAFAPARGAAAAEPERELWKGSYSPKAMIGWWILEGILLVAAVIASIFLPNPITWIAAAAIVAVFGLWLLVWLMVKRLSLEYALTTQQLIHREGLLR